MSRRFRVRLCPIHYEGVHVRRSLIAWRCTPHLVKCLKIVLVESLTSWIDHAHPQRRSPGFYTLFSMTPILVLSIRIRRLRLRAEAAQGEIVAKCKDW